MNHVSESAEDVRRLAGAFGELHHIIRDHLKIMSQAITDFTTKVNAAFTKVNADLDSISTDIASLNSQIVALQNSPGTLSAADQSALDGIVAASAALQTKADNIVPPAVPPAPPGA